MSGRVVARVVAPVAAAVLVATLTGCGGGSTDDGRIAPSDRSTATTGPEGTGAQSYVGLTKRAAIAKADAAGVTWRITREDGEHFPVTQDYDPDRLNFEIDDGTVTSATYG